jgi:glycosyltransferase involved in cell wall biosynthesis
MQQSRRRRILVVAPEDPASLAWGFAIRVHHLTTRLAARHDVTLLAHRHQGGERSEPTPRRYAIHTVPPPAARGAGKRRAQLRSLAAASSYHCTSWRSAPLQSLLDSLCAAQQFDLVQLESSQMSWLQVPPGPVLVLDEHNVEHQLLQRMARLEASPLRRAYGHLESGKARRDAVHAWRRVDGCVATSAADVAEITSLAPATPSFVVPNGVDVDRFTPAPDAVEPDSLVFVGSLNYRPNADAVLVAARQVLPLVRRARPRATLTVVGAGAEAQLRDLAADGVRFAGAVGDVRPFLRRAAAVLVPLRAGGGTRLKLLEALAMGKAAVTTAIGCEGLEVRDGEHLLVADSAPDIADRVVQILGDQRLRSRLGAAGRALVETTYSWEHAAAALDEVHGRLLGATTIAEDAA